MGFIEGDPVEFVVGKLVGFAVGDPLGFVVVPAGMIGLFGT